MMFPVRCFTCGAPIGQYWDEFIRRVQAGENPGKVLDDLGITRYCCRRMFISHIELMDKLLAYSTVIVEREEFGEQ